MLLPGQTLLVVEVAPRCSPPWRPTSRSGSRLALTLISVSMIGAAGGVYLAGQTSDIVLARDEIGRVLDAVTGREH